MHVENVKRILERQWSRKKSGNSKEFVYLGGWLSAGVEYEAAVTARTGCWLVKFWQCGELLYGRRFPLRLKWAVY